MSKLDKYTRLAKEHLDQDEKVIYTVLGAYESKILKNDTLRNGVFLATDRRVVFYGKRTFGYDLEFFPYENISSIEMGKSLMGKSVSFFTSGNKVSMKWINHGDVKEFFEHVRNRIGKGPAAPIEKIDEVDQLRKFAELRKEGVISEEEYEAKKRQLLGIGK